MVSQQDNVAGILLSLHEAALDDVLWPKVSGRNEEACGILGNGLVMGKGSSQVDGEIFFARFCSRGERRQDRERGGVGTRHGQKG